MNAIRRCCLLLTLSLLGCETEAPKVADVVLLDGAVLTMNPAQPQARAVAIRATRIAFVGDEAEASDWIGEQTKVLRLNGVTVLPGLIDSHIHVMDSALERGACSLKDAELKVDQAAAIIKACAERSAGSDWLVVIGINSAGFRADRKALDAIVSDRPMVLWGSDGHTGWVNSLALKRAGITRERADPPDGRIERDGKGEPTGFLVEGAVNLIYDVLEKPTAQQREQALRDVLPELHAAGITTYMEANADAETVATYAALARNKQLTARVSIALASDGKNTPAEFARLRKLKDIAEAQPQLRADIIKLFADGVMEFPAQTAALLEPYSNENGTPTKKRGELYLEPSGVADFVRQADAQGFGIHIHAIGDRGVRAALDAFASARAGGSHGSYSLAHVQLVDEADLRRFRDLNVFASMQLLWAQPDNYSVDALLPYIGPTRQARQYPARAIVSHGGTIAGGSDWSVSSFNPFEAIATAISRTNAVEPERGPLGADQALTLAEMFAAYTINAARMLGRDQEIGSLEPGKAADLIVLDRHLTESSSSADIRAVKVTYTFTNGTRLIVP